MKVWYAPRIKTRGGHLGLDRGSGAPPQGSSQALPIPSVLKPVAITIPEPHKLVKNDVAEQRSRVPVALQESTQEQFQLGQVLVVQSSCGLQHLEHNGKE